MVGPNTVRENYSREGGLDYIVQNRGIITEAVSSQKWPGEAAVHISIVNWTKNPIYKNKKKTLFISTGHNEELKPISLKFINSSLSKDKDVSQAKVLKINRQSKTAFLGQTHGSSAFLLPKAVAEKMTLKKPILKTILKPFLTAHDFIAGEKALIRRYVIDFSNKTLIQAQKHKLLYKKVEKDVLPTRAEEAKKEIVRNKKALKADPKAKVNRHHQNFLNTWWKLSWSREDLMKKIRKIKRYCVCARVTKRDIFEFVSSSINPNDSLIVFTFEDDYSFGILQSCMHWIWFQHRGGSLGTGLRYTTNTVYDTFPWPQNPTWAQIRKVAKKAQELRKARTKILKQEKISYRDLYRSLELPGDHKLLKYHKALDLAVYSAYGFTKGQKELEFLLDLNFSISKKESLGQQVTGPGLPHSVKNQKELVSNDSLML